MSLNHSPSIVRDGLVLYYDMSNIQKSWKGQPTTNITPNLGIVPVQSVTCTYISVEDGWKKYALNGTWTAGTYPYAFAVDSFTCTGGVTYSTGVYVKTNVASKFAALFTGMNYVNAPMNLGGTSFSIPQPDGSIFVGRYGFQYTSTSSQNGYLVSQPVLNQVFNSATDFLYIKSGQIEQNSFCTPFVAGTRYTNNNLESTPSYPTWNQSAASASGGTLTFSSGSYNTKGTWDLYKQYTGLSTGTNYTWSALIKLGTASNFIVTMNNTLAWNTGPSEQFGGFSSTEWKRVSITGTTSTGSFNVHLGASNNTEMASVVQSGGTLLIQDVRLQLTSSQTAIQDLTDQNTITSSNLTYASDGTFRFDRGQYIDINNTSLISGTNPFTIEAAIQTDGGNGEILGNYGSGYTSSNLWFATYGLFINGSVPYFPTAPLPAGTYIIAATRDSYGNTVLYNNGISVATSASSASIPTNINWRIGADVNGAGEGFGGKIYSVKVYNRALSASEVAQNFNALRGRYGV